MALLDEIGDRLAITDLLHRYAEAIDTGTFDALGEIFTPDAAIDYSAMGGVALAYGEMRLWLEKMIGNVPGRMHMLGNIMISLNGDSATATAYLLNAMVFSPDATTLIGGKYNDTLVRTSDGWRISSRRLDMVWKT